MTRLSLAMACGALLWAPAAMACGGFFCNNSQPVDQAGERILFAVEGTTVTAQIQIQYTGPSEKFSWVLPMPSEPTVGLGSDLVFTRLQALTDPQFNINWEQSQDCWYGCDELQAGGSTGGTTGEGGTDNGGVSILAEGAVGAFEYKVVQGETGEALFNWLNENGYDQPDAAEAIVTHYVNMEYVFLAVKLNKNAEAGDLQPLVLTYTAPDLACVPLRLTSIAATPDMPVWSWILGSARAVPMNFFHVQLNAKAYNWLGCAGWWGSGSAACANAYVDMVTKAANAANGNAFVTEFAGKSAGMKLHFPGELNTEPLKKLTTPSAFLQGMLEANFPRNSATQQVIMKWIPKPADEDLPEECKTLNSFYNIGQVDECSTHIPDWTFDPIGMADDMNDRLVKPLEETQALFDKHPYLTRVFTTISPEEMTKDPMFSFNPDLPDVDRLHTVNAKPICEPGENQASKVELTYPNGDKEMMCGNLDNCWDNPKVWVCGEEDAVVEPIAQVQVMSEAGPPENVTPGQLAEKEAEISTRAPNPDQAGVQQTANANNAVENSGTFGYGAWGGPASSTGNTTGETTGGGTGETTGGGTGETTGGGTGESTGGTGPGSPSSGSSSGCTAAGQPTGTTPLWISLALLGLLIRRRRIQI